jgi:hypothetical protein
MGAVALTAACGSSPSDHGPSHRAVSARGQAPAEAPEDRYEVEVELPKSIPGKESLAKVHVHPRGDWHMNTDFPVKLELQTPVGVELVSGKLTREHVERLDDEALTFAVPFTPASEGQKRFEGKLSFAMCGELACDPLTVPVDFTVDVAKCGDTVAC